MNGDTNQNHNDDDREQHQARVARFLQARAEQFASTTINDDDSNDHGNNREEHDDADIASSCAPDCETVDNVTMATAPTTTTMATTDSTTTGGGYNDDNNDTSSDNIITAEVIPILSAVVAPKDLPLSAMDMLRRTDEAAQIIQQRVRKNIQKMKRNEKPLFEEVVDQVMMKESEITEDDTDDEDDVDQNEDDLEEPAAWDMDRFYSLIMVAVFSIGMIIQRCVHCIKAKLGGDEGDENDLEAAAEVADFAQGTGTEFGNPLNANFGGGGGGGGGAGPGAAGTGGGGGGGGGGAGPGPPP